MSKTIVVTGTASGLGRATVDKFAAEGWNVVATVRKESDLRTHAEVKNVNTLLLDIDDEHAVEAFAQLAVDQFGGVDVLVNNAGYYQMGPLEATTLDQVHRQYQTNVFGLIAMTKAFLAPFRAQGAGRVINIASITGDQGYPYNSVYASSKAAVAILSEALNIEMAEFGVVVKTVLPGLHATRIFTKVDAAPNIPDVYHAGIADFFATSSATGSAPTAAAEVIYRAAVDADTITVRYYAGADATSIPQGKRILGAESYWREFRSSVLGSSTALWNALMSKPGNVPVQMEV
jgi:NAD(P)-dependent dehydrogenase (short-subunit alcohol dehydrogenase family)